MAGDHCLHVCRHPAHQLAVIATLKGIARNQGPAFYPFRHSDQAVCSGTQRNPAEFYAFQPQILSSTQNGLPFYLQTRFMRNYGKYSNFAVWTSNTDT